MTDRPRRRYPWQRKRTRVLLFLLVPVVMVSPFVVYRVQLGGQVEARLDALRAAGIPLTRDEFEATRAEVPEAENRAPLIMEAMVKLQPPDDNSPGELPFFGDTVVQDYQALDPSIVERLGAVLRQNAVSLDLLNQAAVRPQSRFQPDADQRLRRDWSELTDLLAAEAAVQAQAGDAQKAVDAVLCLIQVAESLRYEPTFELQRYRTQALDRALMLVGRLVNQLTLPEPQIDRLLAGMNGGIDLNVGLEQAVMGESVRGLERLGSLGSGHGVGSAIALWLGLLDHNMINLANFTLSAVEVVKLPPLESKVAWMDQPRQGRGGDRGAYLVNLVNNGLDSRLTIDVLTTIVRTTLGIERFRAATHQTPESLTVLVPQYLEEVPNDAFSGGPKLVYKTLESGYLLYSVGENGQDDGGMIESMERRPGRRSISRLDLGFKVLKAP